MLASATGLENGNTPPWHPDGITLPKGSSASSAPPAPSARNHGQRFEHLLSIIHTDIEREDFGGDMTAFWWRDRQRASRAPARGLAARLSVDLHRAEGKVRPDEALVRPPLLNMWDGGHERYSRRATGSLSPTAHTPIIVSKARWYLRTGPAACQRSRRSWPSATEHDQHLRFFGCTTGRPRRSPARAVSSGGTPWGFGRDRSVSESSSRGKEWKPSDT